MKRTNLLKAIGTNPIKSLAGIMILLSIAGFFFNRLDWPSASGTITVWLALLFLTRETVNDERVEHLKLKAISLGFGAGLMVTIFYQLFVPIFKRLMPVPQHRLSAYDALIIILVTSLALFHYWRWQDARPVREG